MRDDPLVIFASPRGGSSLVAGVFARHGFWVGKEFPSSDRYRYHENAEIKKWMKKRFPLNAGSHIQAHMAEHNLFSFCSRVVKTGTPWIFKGPSEYYPVFNHWFPDMTPVFVFRNPVQAVEAHVRRRSAVIRPLAEKVVKARYDFMNNILATREDAFRIDAEQVADGDLTQIEDVLMVYGIALNHRLAMQDIKPLMLHR